MNMRLAHGPVRGRSFFPSAAPAHHHIRYVPHRVSTTSQRARQRTRQDPIRMAVAASWVAVALVMALIVAAAMILPKPAPASSPALPWRSTTAGPLLPYERPLVAASVPLAVPHHHLGLRG
ncbi:hypothetical protein [Sinomonas gamaensis]|uniref:hypothetical protein n=1 Tax=Sinomonas gamaensis TaxID=2565624 RepID=UPI001107FA37|nr:hypothetical protein [Sinomonas gamaensis]